MDEKGNDEVVTKEDRTTEEILARVEVVREFGEGNAGGAGATVRERLRRRKTEAVAESEGEVGVGENARR